MTARAVDRSFDYAVSDELAVHVRRGSLVQVEFGARAVTAVVAAIADDAPTDDLKPIDAVTGAIPEALVDLAEWLAAECGSTTARALALVQPPKPAKRALKPVAAVPRQTPVTLTTEQESAVNACLQVLDAGGGEVLVHGVTGSGKTELYLRVIERALALGRSAIVLVPEIALTPQTARRFRARFGPTVAVLHSGLTRARRGDEHRRIAAGEARVVVGARSAVFAAAPGLGVIVVDEEHDASYKHEADPRYDARRVAVKRARLEGAVAIFGSATPRPESWFGVARRVSLPARIGGAGLPRVVTVDLRHDGGYPLTRPLVDALAAIEDSGGRAIVLQNRRGSASALHCRSCATGWRCPRCDVSLTLHGRSLRCHHCGHSEPRPRACPNCGSVDLAQIGAGTVAVEKELASRFPGLEVSRLDADIASRAGEPEATLSRFAAAERAVLVGTQLVAKGHDVAGVQLAAVLDADVGLSMPDFRSEERTFALLTQLAGRPGRPGDPTGTVIVQTWNPELRPIALAARHAVEEFLTGELERRQELGYPPFKRLVRLLVTAPDAAVATGALEALVSAARPQLIGDQILGPAPLPRLRDRERSHVLIKTEHARRCAAVFRDMMGQLSADLRRADATATLDVDPQTLL